MDENKSKLAETIGGVLGNVSGDNLLVSDALFSALVEELDLDRSRLNERLEKRAKMLHDNGRENAATYLKNMIKSGAS